VSRSRHPVTVRRALQVACARYPRAYAQCLRGLGRGSVEKRAFLLLIRAGDAVVDVGANEGYFTLLFSDLVRAAGTVHAFEPVAPTFDRLSQHMRESLYFDNVTLVHAADDYLATPRRVDFVKIDVEGAELGVLQGLAHTLAADRPMLACEIVGDWTRSFGHEPAAVVQHICAAGYDQLFALGQTIEPVTREAAARLADAGSLNLLCASRDRHAARLEALACR
jgi:hypothetical protein